MRAPIVLLAISVLAIGVVGCGEADRRPSAKTSTASTSVSGTSARHEGRGEGRHNFSAYGHAASPADRQAITALVKRYFAAAAVGDGRTACSLLYAALARSVPEDYGTSPPGPAYARGRTCAAVMLKVFKHQPGPLADLAVIDVSGVRVSGENGFAEIRSKLRPNGAISVQREGSSWRVGGLVASEGIG